MSEIIVAYWSGTGNTAAMADYVGQGIEESGKKARVVSISDITPDSLKDASVFALGCPSMGAEQLEEGEMEPFVEAVKAFAAGKTIGLSLSENAIKAKLSISSEPLVIKISSYETPKTSAAFSVSSLH